MSEFRTADALIAEIESSNYFKDNPHLIDKISIYRWLKNSLKKFGMNVMEKTEGVIHIKNYRGTVPSDFGRLALAVHCEKNFCRGVGDKDQLLQSYMWSERVEKVYQQEKIYIGYQDDCKDVVEEQTIVEKLYFNDDCELHFHYSNPSYVKLGRDVKRDACANDCINRSIKDSPYSINIKGETVYANFKDGVIYMEYYGLPADDNGVPVIPETQNGYLEEYLEYTIKRRILEDALMSKDAPNLITMFNYYVQKEQELFERAIVDTSPLSMRSFWSAISKRRQDMAKFDVNLGKPDYKYGSTRKGYIRR